MSEPVFTADWSSVRQYWLAMFRKADMIGKPNLNFLEIGCFEGMATLWLLENVLTHPHSRITVIDTFQGSPEFEAMGLSFADGLNKFKRNIDTHSEKVNIKIGHSQEVLQEIDEWSYQLFDFIYIDGSHLAKDCLTDAVLTWPLLRPNGIMVFDDYHWGEGMLESWERPKIAIQAFYHCYRPWLEVIYADWQFAVRKK